jgi:peroxiredoxin
MQPMNRHWMVRVPLCLLVGLLAGAAPEDEPEVAVSVHGNTIEVKVARDGAPVSGYAVRLRDGAKKVLTEGHTNAEGRWEQFMAWEGTYDVEWGPKPFRRPLTIRETATKLPASGVLPCCQAVVQGKAAPPPPRPWLLWSGVGGVLALVGFTGLVVWVGRLRSRSEPSIETVEPVPLPVRRVPTRGQLVLVALLFAAGLGLCGWSFLHWRKERRTPVPTDDVAAGAREYLRQRGVEPLSDSLERFLAQPGALVKSGTMNPVGDTAPEFELTEVHGRKWRLQEALEKGPVVIVFYYGYGCDHCVSQLFAIQQDIRYFRELGAEIVAISEDAPAETLKQYKRFGAFDFPVLSDPDNKVAEAYGVSFPGNEQRPPIQLHGTFIVDRQGTVQWGNTGEEPFTGNRTLLYKLAALEDRLPKRE